MYHDKELRTPSEKSGYGLYRLANMHITYTLKHTNIQTYTDITSYVCIDTTYQHIIYAPWTLL